MSVTRSIEFAETLLERIRAELASKPAPAFHQKQQLAMRLSKETRASYRWLLGKIEELSEPVRIA